MLVSDTASKTAADDNMCQSPTKMTTTKAVEAEAAAELIKDVPHHHKPRVQFDEDIAQVHVFNRYSETHNVAQNELWYTEIEYQPLRQRKRRGNDWPY